MNLFLKYFLYFFIYSVLGWIVECTFVSIKEKKIVNRGFLIGPYCPIYGYGSIGMILYLEPYKNNLLTVFILAVVICSILEYFTSYTMEKLFKTRWWDYSNKKFNLNGRICGENACLFGIGGVIVVYFIQPIIKYLTNKIRTNVLIIISSICFLVFATDTILSFKIMNKLKNTITSLEVKDSTQEVSKMVKEILIQKHKTFQKRLLNAFPNINLKKLIEIKDFLNK